MPGDDAEKTALCLHTGNTPVAVEYCFPWNVKLTLISTDIPISMSGEVNSRVQLAVPSLLVTP